MQILEEAAALYIKVYIRGTEVNSHLRPREFT